MNPRKFSFVLFFFLALQLAALAQSNQLTTTPPATPAPLKIGSVTFSGNIRARFESWDWFETKAAENQYNYGAATLRLSLSQQREKVEWQVGGAFQKQTFGFIGRPSNGKQALGTLVDVSVDWAVTPPTTLTCYLACVRGGAKTRAVFSHPSCGIVSNGLEVRNRPSQANEFITARMDCRPRNGLPAVGDAQ